MSIDLYTLDPSSSSLLSPPPPPTDYNRWVGYSILGDKMGIITIIGTNIKGLSFFGEGGRCGGAKKFRCNLAIDRLDMCET
jgi:hypothetical protein